MQRAKIQKIALATFFVEIFKTFFAQFLPEKIMHDSPINGKFWACILASENQIVNFRDILSKDKVNLTSQDV